VDHLTRPRLVTLLVVLAAVAVHAVALAGPAAACSCAQREEGDVQFVGAALSREEGAGDGSTSPSDPVTWRFGVDRPRDELPDEIEIRSTRDDAACGYRFTVGLRYRVDAIRLDDGTLFAHLCFGTARFGDPVAVAPDDGGALVADADGGMEWWGPASPPGSVASLSLAAPIVDLARTTSGEGSVLLGADGGVFTLGDARFHGSLGATAIGAPAAAIVTSPSGYAIALADGEVRAFGDAGELGRARPRPGTTIVDAAPTPSGRGRWLLADDGGVFTFGDAAFHGSAATGPLTAPAIALAPSPRGDGYRIVLADGSVLGFGPGARVVSGPTAGGAVAAAAAPGGLLVVGRDRAVTLVPV
jgi:hypothetical protein